ncbi:hypothetical protein D5086_003740 [Populus alba]|uniref:Uncharacterized protein n=1 Tax=Populus alba TaxID=43335 RepID=A0ACC4D6Z6_POPAL
MRPPKAMAQDSYNRGQEHPFFAGLLRDISGKSKDLPIKDSVSDILEPFEQTAFGTLWKIPTSTSFEFQSSQFDSSVDSGGTNDSVKASSPDTFETTEAHQSIPPPQSAASFYNGYSPQFEILESCDSTMRLNLYLKARKNDGESVYPWVENVTLGQDCSCCTLISEKLFLTSPELLAWQGFSRLLLADILMDTGNLTIPHCTLTKYKYMLLLRYKMHDISDLKVVDILRKDFKKWTRGGKPDATGSRLIVSNIGMSSIGISIEQFLAHELSSTEEIKYFQRDVGEASVAHDCIGREILVSAETMEHMRNLLSILSSNASHLPLKAMHQPGLRVDMKAFEIDKVTSRKTIERLLEEFGGASKG